MIANYIEKSPFDNTTITWIYFDDSKYDILSSNHHHFGEDERVIKYFNDYNKSFQLKGIGYYSITDIKKIIIPQKISDIIGRTNVGIMSLPITKYNDKVYSTTYFSLDDFIKIVKSGRTFLLYKFESVGNTIQVRGVIA